MAEVLGIAGGIISLTGLVKQIKSFYNFCNSLRDVPEDIQHITAELAFLRSTLKSSGLQSQQLESQGYDAEELGSLLLVMSQWLQEAEETLKDCIAKANDGRGWKVGKRMRFLLKKKKVGDQVAALERMKATSIEARFNLESSVNQKQHADIQASINMVHADLKPMLLEILAKTNQTSENREHWTNGCSKIPPQLNAETLPRKQGQTGRLSSPKSKICNRAPLGRPTNPQSRSKDHFPLEEFAGNPFHLLVACIFLNTKREAAIPQAQKLLQQYPTPETLAKAQYRDIQPFFAPLGLFKRADWLIKLAEIWLVRPPQTNKLHTKRGGKSTFRSEVAHLQGIGPFANDAWRIFCKDDLYTRAGYPIAIPEWKKVLPTDEGLVAYLHNRWDKEGFVWDQNTGDSQKRGAGLLDEETAASTDTIGLVAPSSSV